MNWILVINGVCVFVGFVLSLIASYNLYISDTQFKTCITDSIRTSLNRASGDNYTITKNIDATFPKCTSDSYLDFPYAVMQIFGIAIPVISLFATTSFKQNLPKPKPQPELTKEERKDAFTSSGYFGIPKSRC